MPTDDELENKPRYPDYYRRVEPSQPITRDYSGVFDTVLLFAMSAAFWLSGIAIFVFQIYNYLRFQKWIPVSLIDGADFVSDAAWLRNPTDWIGVHQILDMAPAALVLVAIGYMIANAD